MRDLTQDALQLRNQGLSDSLIMEELTRRGNSPDQVNAAISQLDVAPTQSYGSYSSYPSAPAASSQSIDGNIYERIEEITENIVDEKWDELIAEVKKIIEWKQKIEERQTKMLNELEKLKEDFTILHQGVLGKLDDYDTRMRDVGTELNAVGRVFKDVVPQFVENVKELSSITSSMKKK